MQFRALRAALHCWCGVCIEWESVASGWGPPWLMGPSMHTPFSLIHTVRSSVQQVVTARYHAGDQTGTACERGEVLWMPLVYDREEEQRMQNSRQMRLQPQRR